MPVESFPTRLYQTIKAERRKSTKQATKTDRQKTTCTSGVDARAVAANGANVQVGLDMSVEGRAGYVLALVQYVDHVVAGESGQVADVAGAVLVVLAVDACLARSLDREAERAIAGAARVDHKVGLLVHRAVAKARPVRLHFGRIDRLVGVHAHLLERHVARLHLDLKRTGLARRPRAHKAVRGRLQQRLEWRLQRAACTRCQRLNEHSHLIGGELGARTERLARHHAERGRLAHHRILIERAHTRNSII